MWYKLAQGFGGGVLSPVELKIQRMFATPADSAAPDASMPASPDGDASQFSQNPVQEPKDEYEKRLWDTLVNRTDSVAVAPGDSPVADDGSLTNDGPAIEGAEARRLSPYHTNPEETTMEEQLEATRQQNVNEEPAQSMSSSEGGRGYQRIRGEFPSASGKGWTGYEDLPSNKSWA